MSLPPAQRAAACRQIAERDTSARQAAGLPSPSLAELRAMRGVKLIRGTDRRELLMRLGVLDRPPAKNRGGASQRGGKVAAGGSRGDDRDKWGNRKRRLVSI